MLEYMDPGKIEAKKHLIWLSLMNIQLCASWATCTHDYFPFPAALESNLELEEEIEKVNLKTSEIKSRNDGLLNGEGMFSCFPNPTHIDKNSRNLNPIETISDDPATDGLTTRPLTPIEDFIISEQPAARVTP